MITSSGDAADDAPPLPEQPAVQRRGRHIVRTLLMTITLGAIGVGLLRGNLGLSWRDTFRQLRQANLGYFLLALAAFHAGFLLRCLRWRVLLVNAGRDRSQLVRLPSFPALVGIMYRAWFVNTVTVAQAGDVYRCFLLKRRTGTSLTLAVGTIVVERLVDLIVVAALLLPAISLAFGQQMPGDIRWILLAAVATMLIGPVLLAALPRLGPGITNRLPSRIASIFARFSAAISASLRRIPLLTALSIGSWLGEGVMLSLVAPAVGVSLPLAQAMAIALVTALLTIIPVTPGGLGVADAGMLLLLERFGVATAAAAALTLLSRAITIGSVIASGGLLCLWSTWHDRRVTPATNGMTSWT